MPFLFIGTTGSQAGQSLLAWALAKRLSEKGSRVGFFKPFGRSLVRMDNLWTDADAILFKQLLNAQEPLEMICPIIGPEQASHQKDKSIIIHEIKSLAMQLAVGKDVLMILGSKHIFFDDIPQPLPDASLISELNADLLLIHHFKQISTTIYSLLSVISLLTERVKGIVINRVPPEQISEIKDQIIPVLHQKGIRTIAVLPEDLTLNLKSVGEIIKLLKGEIICGKELLDRRVAGLTVGAAELHGELLVFKRVYNKIILLGTGDQEVVGIILTGGRRPADQVVEAAKISGIPLIMVKEDSFAAKERLERFTPALTIADEEKVIHFTAMMDRNNSLNEIIRSLGLKFST